jgi:multiple sugar transport system substrate-binding protein
MLSETKCKSRCRRARPVRPDQEVFTMRIRFFGGLALASLLAAVAVSAATARTDQSRNASHRTAVVSIDFWNYWDGDNAKAIQALIDKFNATHPGIQVKNVTFPWGDLYTKMQAAAQGSGDSLPAVAAGDIAWTAALHRSGRLVNLAPAVKKAKLNLADFYPELLKYSYYNRKLEALPVSTNNLALFYNKDLFQKAGLDPSKPPTTWDQLRADAKKIAALGNGIQGFEIYTQPGEGLTWQLQPYIWQAGGDFLNKSYTAPAFNNAAGQKALGFLVGLIQTDHVTEAGQWGAFDKGQAGMRIDGSWMVNTYAHQSPFSVGTAMIPIPMGGKHATNMGGEQIFVFNSASKAEQKAATTFSLWLASTPVQVQWDQATSFMPTRASVANNSAIKKWEQATPQLKAFVVQQQYAHARPPIPNYPAVSDAFSKAIEPAFYGKVSVAQALSDAAKGVTAALGNG